MKSITFLFLILAQNALATDATIYSQIMDFYNAGTEPQFTDAMGWWTGRCYHAGSQNRAYGSMLAAVENTLVVGDDNGPAFPPSITHYRNLMFYGNSGEFAAKYFDELTDYQRNEISNGLKTPEIMSMIANNSGGSLISMDVPNNVTYSVRKNGEYFYGITSALHDRGEVKAGFVYEACYYFKKIN
jgi:hypothetical protein